MSAPHTFQPSPMISGRCEFCNKPGSEHTGIGIRDRIADIIAAHRPIEIGSDFIDCNCGKADFTPKSLWDGHLAAALMPVIKKYAEDCHAEWTEGSYC